MDRSYIMNLETVTWNFENYQKFIQYLLSLQDLKYQKFQSKLILEKVNIIGIRFPILHDLSKKISKGNYQTFLKYNTHYYYEEILLHGLTLGYSKIDFQELQKELDAFLPYNTNWAINDTVCASLKQFKKHQEEGFHWILEKLKSKNPWDIRFGLILLLDHYINDQYIEIILALCCKEYIDHYYVNMAIAWLLSFCYIKYPDKTIKILEEKKLSKWIQNKSISKIRDSYRVSKHEKDYLKTLIK